MDTTTNYQDPQIRKLYGSDPREVPLYSISDVAQYVKVAENTLRSWVNKREHTVRGRIRYNKPLINLPSSKSERLSFLNLAEAFTISFLTRVERISFARIRVAIETMERIFDNSPHPLLDRDFWTDTVDLYTQEYGGLINLSNWGQFEFDKFIQIHLHRIERQTLDMSPVKVYPFARNLQLNLFKDKTEIETKKIIDKSPKDIEVDPLIAWGRPTITGTGVSVEVIASRRRAGETIRFIAKDYGIKEKQVREAIGYVELRRVA